MVPKAIIYSVIARLLDEQGRHAVEITDGASINGDGLDFDSLTTAQLSALLEEALGSDPYTVGKYPQTVRELVAFYG